jgi:hypothetical protein
MSGYDVTAARILVKNRSLWDEFDRQYNRLRSKKDAASENCWLSCQQLELWIREKTAKRPITPIELDNIFIAARKKMHSILLAW